MNRRGFFRSLVVGASAIAARPYLPALAAVFPAPPIVVRIPHKKIMARIRITKDVLDDIQPGIFAQAAAAEYAAIARDLERRWV